MSDSSELTLYVGTYTKRDGEGIYVHRFDASTGALRQDLTVGGIEDPSFLALHPNGGFLYAVNEHEEAGAVSSFAVDPTNGDLRFRNRQPTHGGAPCHLAVDPTGRFLVVANYMTGNLALYPLADDGTIGEASQIIQHEGSGPRRDRQEGPHAHSVTFDPTGSRVYAADLGIDRMMIYRLNRTTGRLEPNDPPSASLPAGAGPRHFAFHPNGRFAYAIDELDSTMTAFGYDGESGALDRFQTLSALPEDWEGVSYGADVHVHPSGRFLYGSNRGHDSIAIFAIDEESGALTPLGYESTRGAWPRNFTLDPSGQWLLAANQESDSIAVFRIDAASGALTPVGDTIWAPMPVCLLFA